MGNFKSYLPFEAKRIKIVAIMAEKGWHFNEEGEGIIDDPEILDLMFSGKATSRYSSEPSNPLKPAESRGSQQSPVEMQQGEAIDFSTAPSQA